MAQYQPTYTSLKTAVQSYCEDDSAEFDAQFQACVNRAEDRIFRDLDLSIFNATTSTTTSSGVGTYSKGYTDASTIAIYFGSGTDKFAERRSYAYIQAHGGSGIPRYFYEDETTIYWAPTPDDSYAFSLTYVVRPNKLTSSNTTNWFTQNAGDLLLYATLIEAETFLIAPDRVQEFEARYGQLLMPLRALWRHQEQNVYEPISPTPEPVQTR